MIVPAETRMVRLGDVASFVRGVTFKPADVEQPSEANVDCMRTKNVQAELDRRDVWSVPKITVKRPDQLLREGDLLVSSANSWNLVGKACWIPALERPTTFGGFVSVLRPGNVDARYLFRWFSSDTVQATLRSFGNQTTNISNLDLKRASNLLLPLPSLDEQRRIAALLDKADELRSKRREALAYLDTLTQSIFHSMFSQFLVGTHSTVGGTGVVQLGRQRAPKYQSGKHTRPYMRVANVKLNELDLSDVLQMDFDQKDFKSYQLHYGDILLNEGQSTELVGRPAMWREEIADCCFQNTLVRYVADPRLIFPEFALATFLYYFHRGEFAKISSKTSSIAHLGAARFARMPMPTPPLELQQTFATRVAAVERLKETHRKHLTELDTLFASLQHRAFKGEL